MRKDIAKSNVKALDVSCHFKINVEVIVRQVMDLFCGY
jgi:hypothetical protein